MIDGRYRAVLAANWTFPKDPVGLADLNGPPNDIAAMRRVLTGGLFRAADVTCVEQGFAHDICGAVEEALADASRLDVVLIYYSGHGFTDVSRTLRLSGHDSVHGRMAGSVGADEIRRMIDRTAAAQVVVLLDCCYAGAFKGGDLTGELAGKGVFIQAASRSTQVAPDSMTPGGMSPFTRHLVRGLQGEAALTGTGHITFVDLYQYVRRRMAEEGPARPQWKTDGEGNPLLAPAPVGPLPPPISCDVTAAPRGVAAVLEEHAGRVPGMLVPPPPRHRLERRVRRAAGVSDREATLALVALAGGAAALFTERALYWLVRDRGDITALPISGFPARAFRAVTAAGGHGATHVDLGNGIPHYAGPAAEPMTRLLIDLGQSAT
ncbi:caspase family protein [Actinoplanes sp. NBRC 103695]|uniref:caspase family protein n=1 Tax=Actinoplanes sp. NBRC 103695 TaxID=3032202 RepID=UPI0024A0EC60|nr:caspase family protein [Actinoplanes sp. NBRC 103695]GLY97812.1 hypothetical protein Acsp02_50660 [Actinoplanes sp. NBRC 103695]